MQKDKLNRKIDQALQAKKLKTARNLLRKLVEAEPGDIRSRLRLGEVLFQLGEKNEALKHLMEVGKYYIDHGFLLKSVAVYKKMVEVDPSRMDIHKDLAKLYFQLGMTQEAMREHKVHIKALLKQGRIVDSLYGVRSLLDLEPGNVRDRIRLAEAFSQHDLLEDAASELSSVMKLMDRRGADKEGWIKVAERYLHHNPKDSGVVKDLAHRLVELGRHAAALPWLELYFMEKQDDPLMLDLLAQVFAALGQPHKAVAVLKVLAKLYGENGLEREKDNIFLRILEIDHKDRSAQAALDRKMQPEEKDGQYILELSWDLPPVDRQELPEEALEITTEPPPIPDEPAGGRRRQVEKETTGPVTKPVAKQKTVKAADTEDDLPEAEVEGWKFEGAELDASMKVTEAFLPALKQTPQEVFETLERARLEMARTQVLIPAQPAAPVAEAPQPPHEPESFEQTPDDEDSEEDLPEAELPEAELLEAEVLEVVMSTPVEEPEEAEDVLQAPEEAPAAPAAKAVDDGFVETEYGFDSDDLVDSAEVTMVQNMDEHLMQELGLLDEEEEEPAVMVDVRPISAALNAGKIPSPEELLRAGVNINPLEMEELEFFMTAGLIDEARMLVNEVLSRK